jgi:serine/threonine protein phosphatase PrpC
MGAGASASNEGSGLRELSEEFDKKLAKNPQKGASQTDVDKAKAVINGGSIETRDEGRNWTVSIGADSLRPTEDNSRAEARSKTTPSDLHRRESTAQLSEGDQIEVNKRQDYLKGRVRRGSVFLGEVQQDTLTEHWKSKATVHFYGKLGCNKPFAEADLDFCEGFDANFDQIEKELNIGLSCTKGKKGGQDTAPNQDNFSVTKTKDGTQIYCVMDGHGKSGHNVSHRTVRTLPYYIMTSVFYPDDMEKCLKDAFELCQLDVMGNSLTDGYDAQGSGTTATCLVRKGAKYWTAHTGDSRIAFGDKDSAVLLETKDHKPDDKAEMERIEAAGGEVRSFKYEDNWTVHRMFIKGRNYPGLCMSRSFGDDCVKEHGVSAVPDVSEFTSLKEHGQTMIVLASDGVWEFLETAWVVRAVIKALPGKGLMKCAKKLTREAKHRWKDEEGDYCDDITALLIMVKPE